MSELRIKLMAREADRLREDADLLRVRPASQSHAAYLLDLLALEILLKCCLIIETGQLVRGHDYVNIFLRLKPETRKALISSAAKRTGPTADYSDPYWLLALFGSNFVHVRYPYEAYRNNMTEAEYLRLGSEWVERGAVSEEARFDFRPNELSGFLHAFSAHAAEKIAG
jgi:hypothetical protein